MIIITVVDFRAPESLETHPNREVKSNETLDNFGHGQTDIIRKGPLKSGV